MKLIVKIVFMMMIFTSFGQEWRDSLDAARSAYKSEDYMKAMKYYESAQKMAPDDVDLSDEMAQSAYKAREFEKAEKIYQQNSNNKKSNIDKASNNHNIGNARMKRKDYHGAIESYKESLRQNPNDDQTRYNLSEAIRQLQNQQNKNNQQNQQQNQNQNQQQNQQQNQNQNQNQKQNQNGQSDKEGENEEKSQLPNKTVDRMLDKLMKEEAETKRRASGSKGKNDTPRSGKDW